jgi:hypothetical protein
MGRIVVAVSHDRGTMLPMRTITQTIQTVDRTILSIRGQRVIRDANLARLHEVETKDFNQAIRRNRDRFPADSMIQFTADEAAALRSRFVTSKGRSSRRYLPYAFSQEGVAMPSNVLGSKRAIEVNSEICGSSSGYVTFSPPTRGSPISSMSWMRSSPITRIT